MSVMSNIYSVTAVFSCLIPSLDHYSSGQERVQEDRDEFLDNITAKVGEEQRRRKERGEGERGRAMNRVENV